MKRSRRSVAVLLALLLASGLHAQSAPPTAHTGDAWVDARLADIGTYAATYHDAFVDEVARYGRAPRELVEALLARPGWTPGDVYFACTLAQQAGRPCREAVDARGADPARDWAAVAATLGVAPGSPAFHALKRAVVASYDRWARPVSVDDDLARDFPGRPRMAAPAAPAGHPPAAHAAGRGAKPGS